MGVASPAYREERWTSASRAAPASLATSAAWTAVAWAVRAARSALSDANVASWTSRSASSAALTVAAVGRVSPV